MKHNEICAINDLICLSVYENLNLVQSCENESKFGIYY